MSEERKSKYAYTVQKLNGDVVIYGTTKKALNILKNELIKKLHNCINNLSDYVNTVEL